MIVCTTMNALIRASYEGIRQLRLDRRDNRSVTSLQKYKTLQFWCFVYHKRSDQYEGDSEGRMIDHGVHVTLRVGGGTGTSGGSKVESFIVNITLTKG